MAKPPEQPPLSAPTPSGSSSREAGSSPKASLERKGGAGTKRQPLMTNFTEATTGPGPGPGPVVGPGPGTALAGNGVSAVTSLAVARRGAIHLVGCSALTHFEPKHISCNMGNHRDIKFPTQCRPSKTTHPKPHIRNACRVLITATPCRQKMAPVHPPPPQGPPPSATTPTNVTGQGEVIAAQVARIAELEGLLAAQQQGQTNTHALVAALQAQLQQVAQEMEVKSTLYREALQDSILLQGGAELRAARESYMSNVKRLGWLASTRYCAHP